MSSLQHKASNPEISTWVSASAGTGKTKILTDRVLRLLLKGEAFDKILCLTFTNAAANEMRERIAVALAKWAKLDRDALAGELQKTIGRKCTSDEIAMAESLYDSYLQSEDNINVQTIHSFCQKLLKKFPLEAGVSPSFKIIDEIKADSILNQIKKHLINQEDLEPINEYLSINFHELVIDEILADIIQQKTKFLGKNSSLDIKKASIKIITELQNSNNDCYELIKQNPIVQNIVGLNTTKKKLKKFFLTDNGQKRKRIVPQKIAKIGSNLYSDLETIQEQIHRLDQKEKALELENHSKLLSILAAKIIEEYEYYKSKKGLLDYDDLIVYSCKLLNDSSTREWVLYKLDGGIDHLLVDEAQDTSHEQWRIIQALIQEFYSGDGADGKTNRTVFVVGDEKQSIFSFQGANIESFAEVNEFLKKKMSSGGRSFENVNLDVSYRSAKEILDVVHHVFTKIKEQAPDMFSSTLNQLQAFRNNHRGRVQLWPLCRSKLSTTEEFWPIVKSEEDLDSAKMRLAKKISSYIKQEINSGKVLAATNKAIAPNDFMILFRKRDEFTKDVMKALQNDGLAVAGLDRITLKENLAVVDLLSIGKFVLNPQDDLNLAALLKSPIFGVSEDRLYDISTKRDKLSVWDYIRMESSHPEEYRSLNILFDVYKKTNVSTFFQYIIDILGFRQLLNFNPDSNDAIDELLYAAADYALANDDSLQNFIFWLEDSNSSIKRDTSSSDKIKIMTLHASKGLQAPIVILCDTTTIPANNDNFIWDKNGNCLSAKNSAYAPDYYIELKKIEQRKAEAEYLRLLYVGMTRAEDELIICGYEGGKSIAENCWFEIVHKTMNEIAIKTDDETLVYGASDKNSISMNEKPLEAQNIEYFTPRNKIFKYEDDLPSMEYNHSPLLRVVAAEYGLVFHKILEDSVYTKDLSIMNNHPLVDTLDDKSKERIKKNIELVIANKEFYNLIQGSIKTEVSIGAVSDEKVKLGRIDLMVCEEEQIIIIDYKSDLHPPSNKHEVSENYVSQLASYKAVVEKIYPEKKVTTQILWLENGQLMEV